MRIDCERCTVRGDACGDCVISVLLGPPGNLEWDETERAALRTLAQGGLVPPLRLVPGDGPVERLRRCEPNHIAKTA